MSLARITKGENIPPEVFRTRSMRGLEDSAADYACLMNDIFSYQKEIEFEGELNNCVLVLQAFFEIDSKQAVLIVNDLMTSRLLQFEHIIATELPLLIEDFQLEGESRKDLDAYVEGLQDWVSGILDWHWLTRRYTEETLRLNRMSPQALRGLSGLGMSAARIESLRGSRGAGPVKQVPGEQLQPAKRRSPATLPSAPGSAGVAAAAGMKRDQS
jgi:germacradienol/geosmin synthase